MSETTPLPALPSFNRAEIIKSLDGGFDFMDRGSYGVYALSLLRFYNYVGPKGQAIVARCAVEGVDPVPCHENAHIKFPPGTEFDVYFSMSKRSPKVMAIAEIEFVSFVRAVQGYATTPKNWNPDIDVDELIKSEKFDRGVKVFVMSKVPGATKEYDARDDKGNVVIENGAVVKKSITYDKTKYLAAA